MSTEYVLVTDHLVLDPLDETSGPLRYRRGDTVDLSGRPANVVKHLKAQGAIATKGSADGKDAAATPNVDTTPPLEQPVVEGSSASTLVAAAASGVDVAALAATTVEGRPAKSASVEVWREYAIDVGAVSREQAADMSKADAQKAVAEHEARAAG